MIYYILMVTIILGCLIGVIINIKYYFGNDVSGFIWAGIIMNILLLVVFGAMSAAKTYTTEVKEFNNFDETGIKFVLGTSYTNHEAIIPLDGVNYKIKLSSISVKRLDKINHIIAEYTIGSYDHIEGDNFWIPSFMLTSEKDRINLSSLVLSIPSSQNFSINILK